MQVEENLPGHSFSLRHVIECAWHENAPIDNPYTTSYSTATVMLALFIIVCEIITDEPLNCFDSNLWPSKIIQGHEQITILRPTIVSMLLEDGDPPYETSAVASYVNCGSAIVVRWSRPLYFWTWLLNHHFEQVLPTKGRYHAVWGNQDLDQ